MILSAGLTPAWQQIVVVEGLRLGEVNRAREVHRFASGKVVNAGLAVRRLGGQVEVLAFAGGATGESMDRDLRALDVRCRWVPSSRPTRVCTTVLDAGTGVATELVENGAPVTDEEIGSLVSAYDEEVLSARGVILTGSLPAGAPQWLFRRLLEVTRCPAVLDVRGPELLEALPLRPFLVKPNREELGATLGRALRSEHDLRAAMDEVRLRGAEWVVVSQGKGMLRVLGPGTWRGFLPPEVPTVNPIGCGDCFAGALAWAISERVPVIDAVRLGMGAAAQNAATLLTSRLDIETTRRLAGGVREV